MSPGQNPGCMLLLWQHEPLLVFTGYVHPNLVACGVCLTKLLSRNITIKVHQ